MKVAMISSAASWHTLRWYRCLKSDMDIRVFSFWQGFPQFGENLIRLKSIYPSKLKFLLGSKSLRAHLREYRPDIVHAHYATGYGYLAAKAGIHPLVISVWGSDIFDFPHKTAIHRKFLGAILGRAEAICATSQIIREAILTLYPVLEPKIKVIPFGIDMRRFAPQERGPRTLQVTIGTAKLLQKHYQLDKLMIIFNKLAERNPNLFLKIAGEGGERENLHRLKTQLACGNRIELMGQIDNHVMPDFLRQLDIFVMPSRFESFGVAALEASACGLPVVAFKGGGVSEIVENNVGGRLVPAGNFEAMAEAIAELVGNEERRTAMGLAAREIVRDKFNIEKSAAKMQELYASLLSRKSSQK